MPEADAGLPSEMSSRRRHDVFISYSRHDKATADAVCAALENAGIPCWIGPRDTRAGAYGRSIMEAIRSARLLVLILSPHADSTPNVLTEVAEAFDRKLPLLPFRLANFAASDEMRFYIRTQHWIDAFPGTIESHLPVLVARAKGVLRKPAPADEADHAYRRAPEDAPAAAGPEVAAEAADPSAKRRRRLTISFSAIFGAVSVGVAISLFAGTESPPPRSATSDVRESRDCDVCPLMILIPSGTFAMGSSAADAKSEQVERPRHQVTIPAVFALGKYAVTYAEWDACYADKGCQHRPDDAGKGRGRRPVEGVSWHDAQAYVAWLSRKTGRRFRLPTEAEWEYAARAGSATAYSWGPEVGRNNANCRGCGSKWDGKEAAPVGSFPANAFGLHEMLGNQLQWVQDCMGAYTSTPRDGSAHEVKGCGDRVARGGSWNSHPDYISAATRFNRPPDDRIGIGFRVARTLH